MKIGIMSLVLLFSAVPVAWADTTVTLNAVDSGFYMQNASHESGNYAVGWYTNSVPNNVELRNYFIFDLAAVTGTVVSASLHLATAPPGFIIYGSSDPSETYTLFDVSTDLASLANGAAGISAYNDLGSGASYGSVVATSALGSTIDVPLNATGIAFLAANHGQVAIGGAITTLAKGGTSEFLFNATSASLTRQLVITTSPQPPGPTASPSTSIPALNEWGVIMLMVLVGLGAAAHLRRRARSER